MSPRPHLQHNINPAGGHRRTLASLPAAARYVYLGQRSRPQDEGLDGIANTGNGFVNPSLRARPRAEKAHANVVVAIVGRVVVAIRRPHILGVIVEVATPDDAIRAGCGSHPWKNCWRKRRVWAC